MRQGTGSRRSSNGNRNRGGGLAWNPDGRGGRLQFGRGAYDGCYSFRAQMAATNPEELVGAALAGCFSMELAAQLARAGFTVEHIRTRASVQVEEHDERWSIDGIGLETEAAVPGISAAAFAEQAERIARESAISRALAGVEVRVATKLLETQARREGGATTEGPR